MTRAERPPGPLRVRYLRSRRAFGRTRPGRALKRLLGREARIPIAGEPDASALISFPGEENFPANLQDRAIFEAAAVRRTRGLAGRQPGTPPHHTGSARRAAGSMDGPPIVNIVLVSHCNFTGNSALHVYAIASELHRRGLSPVIAVPDRAETVEDVGRPPFPVLTYEEARSNTLRFPDGRGPDLVHAFTPRELVRSLTVDLVRAYGCRYAVHMEDSEEAVLSAEHRGASVEALKQLPAPMLDRIVRPRQAHPLRARRFLGQAAGVTVLIERLLELIPPGVPTAVVPAGFDEAVLSPRRSREEVRSELRLAPSDLAIVYPGNIHMVNAGEMRSLYAAVVEVRRAGCPVILVKTGWGSSEAVTFPALGAGLRDLGWVPRNAVPELLAAADILVQPGGPSPFNDFRFPSKLPEFLASGRPVVLPRTNLGLKLRDGEEALVLERGDASEIAAAVMRLAADPALRANLGEAGRAYALRELRWSQSVDRVEELYREIAGSGRPAVPSWALDGADPPVKLVALVPGVPSGADAELARSHGIYGFCLNADAPLGPAREFRYCFRADGSDRPEFIAALSDPSYIRIGGEPLLTSADPATPYESLAGERDPVAISANESNYIAVLRKLVLRALLLAEVDEPLILVDASQVWSEQELRLAWLAATRAGLSDGIRQYYGTRGLALMDGEIDEIVRAS